MRYNIKIVLCCSVFVLFYFLETKSQEDIQDNSKKIEEMSEEVYSLKKEMQEMSEEVYSLKKEVQELIERL